MTSAEQAVDAALADRIDRMHARDRFGLIIFVVVLWATMLFALLTIWPFISVPAIRAVLAVFCGLVLIFNTAAVVAMLRHYLDDKHFIYGLDLKHLDEMRARRR
jgi:polyferredoxin